MKRLTLLLIAITLTAAAFPQSTPAQFIYASGDTLMDENGPLRFVSFNIPCLHYNEDNLPFTETNPWRLPDEFEIRDALEAVRQMGGQVVRVYTLSVRKPGEDPAIPRHVLGPGRFYEPAFAALDKVMQIAGEKGIRVIIPFVDNWIWWGGRAEYAAFRGKDKDAFWTDPQIIDDFKQTVNFLINRRNTCTGILYKDDPALLAWETGNELTCPHSWTAEIAAYIKSLDHNHLLIDGFHTERLRDESLTDPHIDIVTTHHYASDPQATLKQILDNSRKARGKKPYFVGEFGFLPTADVREILDAVIENNLSGALIWSLRYRSRDGGFYWHSEPHGGDLYKACHWPGFASGSAYDETALMALMRQKAYQIHSMTPPALPVPAAPTLLPIDDPAAISWQGSAGTEHYTLLRADRIDGPWSPVAAEISDAWCQYRPLAADTSAASGQSYFYRVTAHNAAGDSSPSNIVGPVRVKYRTLVDEFTSLDQLHTHEGNITLDSARARRYKEDIHRLSAPEKSAVIYKIPSHILAWKVFAFFPEKIDDITFLLSDDGESWHPAPAERRDFFSGRGEYGYARPVLYEGLCTRAAARFLKLVFNAPVQLSRLEIQYGRAFDPPHSTASPVGFVKAFSWGWTGWRNQYLGPEPADSMKKLADTHADWVCITFGTEMDTFDTPHIPFAESNLRMVTDDEIRRAVRLARQNKLKVILKPVVNVRDGTWRAWIKFNKPDGTKDLDAWQTWWHDFRAFLLHYAALAEETRCEMLCLGCEMESAEPFEENWRRLIAEIRLLYSGPLTYNANHGRESAIPWWDALDIISLSAYYPVGTDDVGLALQDDLSKVPPADSSVEAMKRRWLPIKEKLRAVSENFDRPLLFIELGCCSARGYSAAPWTHHSPDALYDGDEQRRYYQAAIESFWHEPWFIGFAWWAWLPQLYPEHEAQTHTGFCPYGKPAEDLVRQWYQKSR